jgi:hypothetical protein
MPLYTCDVLENDIFSDNWANILAVLFSECLEVSRCT